MPKRDIIVVGGSAGSLAALSTIVTGLPRNLGAAVFVVIHLSPAYDSRLAEILTRAGQLRAVTAADKLPIEPGTIYVAAPDRHLLIEDGHMKLVHGPKENRSRPAIDPLFRSAAINFGSRVIGIILSGALDDGAAGLRAIKRSGGLAIVQAPDDAAYPAMPQSAIENDSIDHIAAAHEIAPLLKQLLREQSGGAEEVLVVKDDLQTETAIISQQLESEQMIESVNKLGRLTMFTCPECHGTLWELKDGELVRYRCHVGHAFSIESLEAEHGEQVESALWSALRALEERGALARRIARLALDRNSRTVAKSFEARAKEADTHAASIRAILLADPERSMVHGD